MVIEPPEVTAPGPALRTLRRIVDIQSGEVRATLLSAVYFFLTMSSFFILRPIRDEMAVASGVRSLPWLFAGTLGAMLVANPLYAAVVARFPVRRFVAITYGFFAANLLAFYALWRMDVAQTITGRTFFIWTSVYNLFVVSVFWSVMADTFHHTRAKRLFGFIAVGGTIGSISGSGITSFFAERVGVANLLLISAGFVIGAAFLVGRLPRLAWGPAEDGDSGEAPAAAGRGAHPIGGSIWAGMTHVARSPYLAGIAGFLLLYTFGSTVLYFAQTDIIGRFYEDREARTAVLARIELVTQVLTAFGQAFLTGRVIRGAGLPFTLAAVPAVSMLGFAAIGATAWGVLPLLATFVAFNVLRRTTEFVLTNPSRKVLFTVISREDKYKAANFLETFVYRAGDQIASWGYAGLLAVGLTLTGISWVAVPLAGAFLALGVWLGRRQEELARSQPALSPAPAGVRPPG